MRRGKKKAPSPNQEPSVDKATGIDLKENHLKQAIDYAANHNVQWVILTNGAIWKIYKMRFEQPISYDLICTFNFMDINLKKEEDKEKLFVFS
jgi:predicted type IV restriction endonuclease